MGFFTKVKDRRVVKWALPDEPIPLKCKVCGAVFITANHGPIGKFPIRYGIDFEKSRQCERDKHHLIHLIPDKKIYYTQNY